MFAFFVLPTDFWLPGSAIFGGSEHGTLCHFLHEASLIRRRIAKGANLESERMRYTFLVSEIESRLLQSGVARSQGSVEAAELAARNVDLTSYTLPVDYFDLLARAHLERLDQQASLNEPAAVDSGADVGASLFPPPLLDARANLLDRLAKSQYLTDQPRLQELALHLARVSRVVAKHGGGLVEVCEVLDNQDVPPPPQRPKSAAETRDTRAPQEMLQKTNAKGRRKMIERLAISIDSALELGDSVNMSDQSHEVNTEVLARYLFNRDGLTSGQIRISYADGSEAKPFPIRTLEAPQHPATPSTTPAHNGVVELSVALMSMRHLELDPFVDWAWYRNKEVSQTRLLAESDEFCFKYSMREFADLRSVYEGQSVLLRMFHTGFEPAAIGFYRALVSELTSRRGWLRVLPHYYRGGSAFEVGAIVWE